MIKLNHITKRFESGGRTVTAVDDVSLAINAGEVFGIIGFSGAGKSTLVRCINLLERPTSGEVIVDGVDLTQLDEKALRQVRQRIGMIFQHFNLMPSRTVTENIEMPLKLTTLTPAERKAKISSLLELVELSDKADAYPSQLSGGQKQRVAIARALANDPKVLLCDEASAGGQPAAGHHDCRDHAPDVGRQVHLRPCGSYGKRPSGRGRHDPRDLLASQNAGDEGFY